MNTPHIPDSWGCVDTSNHAHDYRLTKSDGSPLPVNAVANDHSEQRAYAVLIGAAPELAKVLAALLPYVETVQDEGSDGAGWQSDCLSKLIGKATELLERVGIEP